MSPQDPSKPQKPWTTWRMTMGDGMSKLGSLQREHCKNSPKSKGLRAQLTVMFPWASFPGD